MAQKVKIKEDESEDEVDKATFEGEETEEEETEDAKKARKKKKMIDEDDEDDVEKGELGGENPEESAESGNDANSTISPNAKTPSKPQNVFVPASNIAGNRIASGGSSAGQSPSDVTYSSKSVETDLLKSPLFVELSKQIEEFQKSVAKKLEAVEKSVSDRLVSMQKTTAKIEAFYKQPLYKAVNENVSPEASVRKSIKEQVEAGQIRFSE